MQTSLRHSRHAWCPAPAPAPRSNNPWSSSCKAWYIGVCGNLLLIVICRVYIVKSACDCLQRAGGRKTGNRGL